MNRWLPDFPVRYELSVKLALTTREPFRSHALQIEPGQPLRLQREPDNPYDSQAIRVDSESGLAVGYLYADLASCLSILLDHYHDLTDHSFAESVLKATPANDPAARKHRYPVIRLRLCLDLARAWPLFAIIAVLGIKDDHFAEHFNLAGNPWLAPLQQLHEQYLAVGHDQFRLPAPLAKAWIYLTGNQATSGSMSTSQGGKVIF